MSRSRWLIVVVLVMAFAVAAAVATWQSDDDDGDPLSAVLTDLTSDSSDDGSYPLWATDGRTPIELVGTGGALKLIEPLARRTPPVGVTLRGGSGAQPQAAATLPGQAGGPWVAVARRQGKGDGDDPAATDRPLVWSGQRLGALDPAQAADAAELPVDLPTNQDAGAGTAFDAAVARLGGQDVAVVATRQNESNEDPDITDFSVCRLDDCRWQPGAVPANTVPDAVGSTGEGLVAFTTVEVPSVRNDIWYADDAALTWRRIGSAPRGATLQLLQDGPGVATLVWQRRGQVSVQTVRDGKLGNDVPFAGLEGDKAEVTTVLELDGRWYLGGSRPSQARLELPVGNVEPVVWELSDESWEPLDDALLSHQPGQRIEVLFAGDAAGLQAISSSALHDIVMGWRFTQEAR